MIYVDDQVSSATYFWQSKRREWSNFSFRRHRQFDGYLVTMHQSGTHWLKYLLTLMIAREHNLPTPDNIAESLVIGGPRQRPKYETQPRIGHSHTIPSPLLRYALALPSLEFPRYLVLVRDIRDVLTAHYSKWGERYACSFSEYLRGDIGHRRFEKDIWWDFRYMNAWGSILAHHPRHTCALRYEDLKAKPRENVRRVVDFFALPFADVERAIEHGIIGSSKGEMAEKDNHPYGLPVVHNEQRSWDAWYSATDRDWFSAACRRHLRYDFGYDYSRWD